MEKLLRSKNIETQPIQDLYSDDISFAYTKKLLDLNVLIEYYGVSSADTDEVWEEVAVFAHLKEGPVIHSYVLLVSNEVLGPLPIYRVIVDAVEFIERCEVKNVVEEMKAIATSYEVLTKAFEDPEFYENAIYMHNKAIELIQLKRTPLN